MLAGCASLEHGCAADWGSLQSPKNYFGSERAEKFSSPGGTGFGARRVYIIPARLALNHWALAGDWTMKTGSVVLNEASGQIAYRFHARDLHLVMEPMAREAAVRFRVLLDGKPPGVAHGVDVDVDEQGNTTATGQRLYQLIRQPKPIAERQFEIEFLDSGMAAFVFTFGRSSPDHRALAGLDRVETGHLHRCRLKCVKHTWNTMAA